MKNYSFTKDCFDSIIIKIDYIFRELGMSQKKNPSDKKSMKMLTKLVLIVGASILVSCISVAAASLFIFDKEIMDDTMSQLDYTAYGVEYILKDLQESLEGDVKMLSEQEEMYDLVAEKNLDDIREYSNRISEELELDLLMIMDNFGNVIGGANDQIAPGTSLTSLLAVREALQKKDNYTVENVDSVGFYILSAAPVYDLENDGKILATVLAGFSLEEFPYLVRDSYNVESAIFCKTICTDTSIVDDQGNSLKGANFNNPEIVDKVLIQGQRYRGEDHINNEEYYSIIIPITCKNRIITGMIFIAKSIEKINAVRNNTLKIVIPMVLLIAAIFLILCFFFMKWIVRRINNVVFALKDMATGEADLTKRVKFLHRDEIGDLAINFNDFCTKLQQIVAEIKQSKLELESTGGKLAVSTENTTNSIGEIIGNLDSIHHQISSQNTTVASTASAVDHIIKDITNLNGMITDQSAGIAEASSAVEQMIGSISSVTQSVDIMADSFNSLSQNATVGFAKQQDVNERILLIEKQSQMLREANMAISSIASQTNLLAMNAAIEAAHAGEAGRGFSVVADEIRKLSETSSVQSKTISSQLKKIQGSIEEVVQASTDASSALTVMSGKIKETDGLMSQIKLAMEEQDTGSRQILESLRSMNESTQAVQEASKDISYQNESIMQEIQSLQTASDKMSQGMNDMAMGAHKIRETGMDLGTISQNMKESIQKIGGQIDLFTV